MKKYTFLFIILSITFFNQFSFGQTPAVSATDVSDIEQTTAKLNGIVTSNGPITGGGFYYSSSNSDPDDGEAGVTTIAYSGSISLYSIFGEIVTGLSASTTYYYKAYAINSNGTSVSDNTQELITLAAASSPSVTTNAATLITSTTVTLNGEVTADGGASITSRGVCYSTTTSPDLNDDFTTGGTTVDSYSHGVTGLTANTTYYIRAYATNSAGTSYGSETNFATLKAEPTIQVSDITFGTVTSSSIVVNWSGGNGDNVIIVAKESSSINDIPSDGTDYNADNVFNNGQDVLGAGEYIVFDGSRVTGTVTVSNLTQGKEYFFRAFTYNNTGTDIDYKTGSGSGANPTSTTTFYNEPTTQATTITFSNIQTNQIIATSSGGDGSYRVILAKAGTSVNSTPVDGTEYTGNASFGTGQQIGSGNYVVYAGSGSAVTVTNLAEDTRYYFKVFEYNNTGSNTNYKTDGFGTTNPDDTITIKSQPSTQAINLSFSTILTDGLDLTWERGNGDSVLVLAIAGSSIADVPVDGNVYNANSVFGSGDLIGSSRVVYSGVSTSMSITGLSASSEYTFKVFEFNNAEPSTDYLTGGSTNNPQSQYTVGTEPTGQATNITFSNIQSSQMTLSWTAGTGGGNRLVLARQGGNPDSNPVDGFAYSANGSFENGDEIGTGNFVVYNGNGTGVTVTNLQPETTYHFAVYEYSGTGTAVNYLNPDDLGNNPMSQTTSAGKPNTQASNIVYSALGSTSYTINWTDGDGDGVIVVGKAGSALTAAPSDATTYTANSIFTSGDEIGTGNFVVYDGTGVNSVTVTGLVPDTEYTFKVFAYNTISTVPYYQDADATNNPLSRYALATQPTSQAKDIVFSNIAATQLQLDWTVGASADGTSWLVLASTSVIDINSPVDGEGYNADAAFGSGDPINTDYYVVSNGASTTVTVTNLTPSVTYFFKVFEYNGSITSSNYVTGDGVTGNPASQLTVKAEPTVQANNIRFSTLATDSYTVDWVRGDVAYEGVLIVASQGAAVTGIPQDGTTYAADAAYGTEQLDATGDYVVYNGIGTTEDITSLLVGNEYHFRAFEYTNSGTEIDYFTDADVPNNNPNSQYSLASLPVTQASALGIDGTGNDYMNLLWTRGSGDGIIILAREGSAVNTTPTAGITYSANTEFAIGDEVGTGNYVVYVGSAALVTVTGLSGETTYHYQAFEYNSNAENYLTTLAPVASNTTGQKVAPTTQSSSINFTNINTTSFTINWTKGNGDGRIVAVKEGAGTITNPSDDVTYAASANWSSKGTELGSSGYYTVYNGVDETVALTNLSPNTLYTVQIFEYNNPSGSEKYYVDTDTDNPNNQTTLKEVPSTQASAISLTNLKTTSIDVSWANGNGENRIVVARLTASSNVTPTDFISYSANTVFGSGDITGTGNYVVYNGVGGSAVTVTGLAASTSYTFVVYEYNNSGSNAIYNTTVTTDVNSKADATLGPAIWDGSEGTDWNTALNWDTGVVPDASISVTIADVTNQPVVGADYSVENLTIQAGATLIINNGFTLTVTGDALLESPSDAGMSGSVVIAGTGVLSVSGSSTIERSIPASSRSYFFSSPIESPTINDFSGCWVGEYDEPTLAWSYLTLASSMSSVKGYELYTASAQAKRSFAGTFNNGNKSIGVTNGSVGDDNYGWNLVGNPYPSTIDIDDADVSWANIDATIYVYTGSSYASYNVSTKSGDASIRYLAPMQGFFVHANSASGTFAVSNALRDATVVDYKSTPTTTKQSVKLNVSSEFYSSNTTFVFYEGATEQFDTQYDGYKLMGYNDSIPEIYSFINGTTKASINTFPVDTLNNIDVNGCVFDLGIKKGTSTTLSISINSLENIPDNIDVILIDNQEQIQVNLLESSYEFSTVDLTDDRFQLQFYKNKTYVESISTVSNAVGDSVSVNNTLQFSYEVLPIDATNQTVVWSVDNSTVASIDAATGLFSAMAEGIVTVTAKSNDGSGIISEQLILVYSPTIFVNSIVASSETEVDSVEINSTLKMIVEVLPVNASNGTVTWSVDNEDIASVNSTGLITGKSEGIINVTVTANDGSGVNETKTIVVYNPMILVSSIVASSASNIDSIEVNGTLDMVVQVLPINASNSTVTWAVDDESIASVSSIGLLTGKSEGTIVVSATANDGSGVSSTKTIVVYNPIISVSSIVASSETGIDSVEINSTLKMVAQVFPENATNQTYTWSVDKPEIAFIDASTGILSARAEGVVEVMAISNANQNITDKILINVYRYITYVSSISIESDNFIDSVELNSTLQLFGYVMPADASNSTVTWSVNNGDVAIVNSTGLLTGKSLGNVIVTAAANDGSGVTDEFQVFVYNYTEIISNEAEILVKFYPNPTSSQITLETGFGSCNYKIYNAIGKVILLGEFSNNAVVDMSGFESGTYFIEFTQNGNKQVELLIKE